MIEFIRGKWSETAAVNWPDSTTCERCGARISFVGHQGRDTRVNPIARTDPDGFYVWEPHYCGDN